MIKVNLFQIILKSIQSDKIYEIFGGFYIIQSILNALLSSEDLSKFFKDTIGYMNETGLKIIQLTIKTLYEDSSIQK